MDAPLDAVHRVLLLHLHRVTQAQRPEEQVLMLLQVQSTDFTPDLFKEYRSFQGTTNERKPLKWRYILPASSL